MKNIFTIIKKELRRFFTDKRMLAVLILPGLLIYVVYSLMGEFITESFTDKKEKYVVYTINQPEETTDPKYSLINSFFAKNDEMDIEIKNISETDQINQAKEEVANGKAQLVIEFEEDFLNKIISYDVNTNTLAPQIKFYYNTADDSSGTMYNYYISLFDSFETTIANKFDINRDENQTYDLAPKGSVTKKLVTMILPYLLIILLFSGCMSITPESIAGEKERGTIATLLVTPINRTHLAIGKMIALSIVTLVSATSSFLGILLSFPKLMQGAEIDVSIYNVGTYVAIFAVILSSVLLFNAILSILSAFAKSVKEATTYSTPVMLLVLLCGFSSMISEGQPGDLFVFFIPAYNSVQAMSGIFSGNFNIIQLIITICSNIVYFIIGAFVLAKMFNSERVMFNK